MRKTKIVSFTLPVEVIESALSKEFDASTLEIKKGRHDLTEDEVCEVVNDAHLLQVGHNRPVLTRKILESAKNVELIHYTGIGYDSIDLEAATELGIPVANNPGVNLTQLLSTV
jgi:D-3-phosphoglycerate dehydrogenase